MSCDETQALIGPYLDSELDVRTTGEIQQHLGACPACARALAAEQHTLARLSAALRRGEPTPTLWDQAEQLVRKAARADAATTAETSRADLEPEPDIPQRARVRQPAQCWWRTWLWPSPQFYGVVAAVWACILALNLLTGDLAEAVRRSPPHQPSQSPDATRAFAEQRRELAELLGLSDGPAPATQPAWQPPQTQIRKTDEPLFNTALNRLVSMVNHA